MKHEHRNHSIPRICVFVALTALCGLTSCEKAHELAGKMKEKSAEAASPATSDFVTQISAGDFDAFRTQPGKVVVIDFYADWCGPCRKLAPILDRIASDHGGVVLVGKVNVDQNRELAASAEVRSIPDVRIFRDGREVDRFVGLPGDVEVRRRIEIHTKGLKAADPNAPAEETPAAPESNIAPTPKDWLPPGIQRR